MKGQNMKQITRGKKIREGDTLMVIDEDVTVIGKVTHVSNMEGWKREFSLGESMAYAFYLSDVTDGTVKVFRMQKGNR